MLNKKAIKIVDRAILKAKQEKNTKGYRENLGYDQYPKVQEQIDKLDLSYSENSEAMNYFNSQCDLI